MDAEYDHDASLAMYESRASRGTAEQRARRDKAAQVPPHVLQKRLLPRAQLGKPLQGVGGQWHGCAVRQPVKTAQVLHGAHFLKTV